MSLTLQKGSSGRFVELEQNDVVRRFLVPEISGLEGRIQNLVRKTPGLILVRIGRAVVASKDETEELRDGLQGVPSNVLSCYTVDLCGDHPLLGQGPARYSQEFIQTLSEMNPLPAQAIEVEQAQSSIYDFTSKQQDVPTTLQPPASKPDLAASFRAQVEQQKAPTLQDKLNAKLQEKKEEPLPQKSQLEVVTNESKAPATIILPQNVPVKKEEPVQSETQKTLDEAIAESRRRKQLDKSSIRVMEQRPQGKIDILLEKVERIESILTDGVTGEVTAHELSEWFYDHVETIGHDKTFAILASRLKK